MRILQVLTYYRPHTSGLTIYVERLAHVLAERGHEVTVLTSRFSRSLPATEASGGVTVVRVPVVARVSKGVIMPTFGWVATREVLRHDVVHLHLPQLDAAGVALRGRLFRRPTVITYHCDLTLPRSPLNRVAGAVILLTGHAAARLATRVVTYTRDFADHSPFLARYQDKLEIITPPIALPEVSPGMVVSFAAKLNPEGRRPVVGMAARLAAEKGVEVLLDALPHLVREHPDLLVLFAGQHLDVLGEESYRRRLAPAIDEHTRAGRWRFAGVLDPEQMAVFFANLDVLVVPSLNATESFGLVQVEAMTRGVPVVASDLPGVRQPVAMTGMGRIAEVGSSGSLAVGVLDVLAHPQRYRGDVDAVAARFSSQATATAYERLYEDLLD